jgi:histone-lysine N-methyltransferase SETMAR
MTRRQSNNQWSGGRAANPSQKNSEYKNSLENFWLRFFGDQDGILLIDYLPKGQTINAEYYLSLLVKLKDILEINRCGNFNKWVLFLQGYGPAHRALATQKKLAYLGFQCLDHPPYSLDLAPSIYHLFPGLKSN